MPLFKVDIQKSHAGEFWTNRYIVDEVDLETAHSVAIGIVEAERNIHFTNIFFDRVRTSDMVPDTDNYITMPLNFTGEQVLNGELLPLFNVVRVDFGTAVGRPSRKYLRGVLTDSNVNQFEVNAATVAFVGTNYGDLLVNMAAFVDVDGSAILNHSVHPRVGMRQLRRGSRRRTTPIIP